MKVYIYPTDRAWYRYLEGIRPDEVNFWRPGGRQEFKQLSPGDLFLFRFGAPDNVIVGGATYTHFSFAPIFQVWEAFGQKNGAPDINSFLSLLATHRSVARREDLINETIGNIVLTAPFFLERHQWIPIPPEYSPYAAQGHGFDSATDTGAALAAQVEAALQRQMHRIAEPNEQVRFGEVVVRRRMGQGGFALVVADAYQKRCAITGERTLPVLEAAHIKPVTRGGLHRPDNGLLLRTDIHRLFDRGYVTVTPERTFRVSSHLQRDWHNGRVYYELDGKQIRLPDAEPNRPSRTELEWHNDVIFKI